MLPLHRSRRLTGRVGRIILPARGCSNKKDASVVFKFRSLCCIIGVAALMLPADVANAQFFPFFGPQPQQRAPQPAPPPQQAKPPARKATPRPDRPSERAASPRPQKSAPPATAAVPYPEVRSACATEIRSTCAGVVPGSAESVQCLRPNFAAHLPPCQEALANASKALVQPAAKPESKPDEPAGTSDSPRIVSTDRVTQPEGLKETPPPDLKLPAMRPTQEARWVNRHCREDHSLLCQGVTFGQSRVLKCLLSHHSSLTNSCRKALAKR